MICIITNEETNIADQYNSLLYKYANYNKIYNLLNYVSNINISKKKITYYN